MSQHCLLSQAWTACQKSGEVTPKRFKNSTVANENILLKKHTGLPRREDENAENPMPSGLSVSEMLLKNNSNITDINGIIYFKREKPTMCHRCRKHTHARARARAHTHTHTHTHTPKTKIN